MNLFDMLLMQPARALGCLAVLAGSGILALMALHRAPAMEGRLAVVLGLCVLLLVVGFRMRLVLMLMFGAVLLFGALSLLQSPLLLWPIVGALVVILPSLHWLRRLRLRLSNRRPKPLGARMATGKEVRNAGF